MPTSLVGLALKYIEIREVIIYIISIFRKMFGRNEAFAFSPCFILTCVQMEVQSHTTSAYLFMLKMELWLFLTVDMKWVR